jgi:UDP-4-keto-6-deoxy-N-acetylglucosamine 4-aminotransferase
MTATTDPHAFLPYGRQSIDEADIEAVVAALKSDFLTTGPRVETFERAFAERVGAAHAVACANGTAALHMAMMALGIGPGDLVIVPTLTFVATANAVRFQGADVVFADVDPVTGLMTPQTLEAAMLRAGRAYPGRAVRAVVPVHLAGRVCDMETLHGVAEAHGAVLIEDACHAVGSRGRRQGIWQAVGSCDLSAMACFSFHPVKTMTTAEGGMVTTADPALAERLRLGRSHGLVRDPQRFHCPTRLEGAASNPLYAEQQSLGFNYRLSDLQCALGLSQLQRLEPMARRRVLLADRYRQTLAGLADRVGQVPRDDTSEPVLHLQVVHIDFAAQGLDRGAVMQALKARGIGTQVHYPPVADQPYYVDLYGPQDLPGARRYYETSLSLPLYPDMGEADVDRVVEALDRTTRT